MKFQLVNAKQCTSLSQALYYEILSRERLQRRLRANEAELQFSDFRFNEKSGESK